MDSDAMKKSAEALELEKTVKHLRRKGVKVKEQAEALGLTTQAFNVARNYDNPARQLELTEILKREYAKHFEGVVEQVPVTEVENLEEELQRAKEENQRLLNIIASAVESRDSNIRSIVNQRLEEVLPQIEEVVKKLSGRTSDKHFFKNEFREANAAA